MPRLVPPKKEKKTYFSVLKEITSRHLGNYVTKNEKIDRKGLIKVKATMQIYITTIVI